MPHAVSLSIARNPAPLSPFHRSTTLGPIGVGELRFLRIRRAECVGGIRQSEKANRFEEQHVQRRNGLDRNHRRFNPEVQVCVWEI